MDTLSNDLRKLRHENADVAIILDAYKNIEKVYLESLRAMGILSIPIASTENSGEITLTFDQAPPTVNLEG